MVYLARIEDTDNAKITWAFNFAENNLKIKDIHLTLATAIYENGLINVRYLHKGNSKQRERKRANYENENEIKTCNLFIAAFFFFISSIVRHSVIKAGRR